MKSGVKRSVPHFSFLFLLEYSLGQPPTGLPFFWTATVLNNFIELTSLIEELPTYSQRILDGIGAACLLAWVRGLLIVFLSEDSWTLLMCMLYTCSVYRTLPLNLT